MIARIMKQLIELGITIIYGKEMVYIKIYMQEKLKQKP